MQVFVACDEPSLVTELLHGFRHLNVHIPMSRLISISDSRERVLASIDGRLPIVLMGITAVTEEIHQVIGDLNKSGVEVIAFGRSPSPELMIRTIRCGARDFVDVDNNLREQLEAVWSRPKSNAENNEGSRSIFSVIPCGGGSGASILAVNLAARIAMLHEVCSLIDLNLRGGDLSSLLRLTPRHTIFDLSERASFCDASMVEQCLEQHESGIRLLATPEMLPSDQKVDIEGIANAVNLTTRLFAHTVADLGDVALVGKVPAIANSKRFLLSMRLDYCSVRRARLNSDYLCGLGVPKEKLVVVANRTGRAKELSIANAEKALDLVVSAQVPDEPKVVNLSTNLGIPVLTECPNSKAARSIRELVDLLLRDPSTETSGSKAGKNKEIVRAASWLFGTFTA